MVGALLRTPLTLTGHGNGVGRLGDEIILLNCCKCLQISRTFFQVITMPVRHSDRSNGFSCCLYRTFVTWKLVLGHHN